MVGAVSSSATQQLYSSTQTPPAKSAPAKSAPNEEMTESASEKSIEMGKGEKFDAYA